MRRVSALFSVCFAILIGGAAVLAQNVSVGSKIENFSLPDIAGKTQSLNDLKGRIRLHLAPALVMLIRTAMPQCTPWPMSLQRRPRHAGAAQPISPRLRRRGAAFVGAPACWPWPWWPPRRPPWSSGSPRAPTPHPPWVEIRPPRSEARHQEEEGPTQRPCTWPN